MFSPINWNHFISFLRWCHSIIAKQNLFILQNMNLYGSTHDAQLPLIYALSIRTSFHKARDFIFFFEYLRHMSFNRVLYFFLQTFAYIILIQWRTFYFLFWEKLIDSPKTIDLEPWMNIHSYFYYSRIKKKERNRRICFDRVDDY